MSNKLIGIKNRIYSDYFMKNRFEEYEEMIKMFLDNGFLFAPIKDIDSLDLVNNKYIFLRHDIDSEPKVAEKMFNIEQKYGICTTYYFRLSTLDVNLARKMISKGVEVGYHYEELAEYAKMNKIKDGREIKKHIEDIEKIFIDNTVNFEKQVGFKMETVVSHGDWMNRTLGVTNKVIVTKSIKSKLNLKFEGYEIENKLDFRLADRGYPQFWVPTKPEDVLKDKNMRIGLLLIHPRQWCSAPIDRFKQDFSRVYEAIRY